MKYRIEVIEMLSRTVEVEAENEDAAIDQIREDYISEKIVLDYEDYAGTEYIARD